MKRLVIGLATGITILSFQNCSEPDLAFDHADHSSALGIELRLVADPNNIRIVENDQHYTAEIVLPEKGEIDEEAITVDGVRLTRSSDSVLKDFQYKKNALGNLEFKFQPAKTKTYVVKAEVWTPNRTKFEAVEELVIKDDLAPEIKIIADSKNLYKYGNNLLFDYVVIERGGSALKSVTCAFIESDGAQITKNCSTINARTQSAEGQVAHLVTKSGAHSFVVKAEDSSGNKSELAIPFSVDIDTIAPVLTVQADSKNSYYTGDVQKYNITASDLGSGLNSVTCELKSPTGVVSQLANCYSVSTAGLQVLSLPSLVTGTSILTVIAKDKETPQNGTSVSVSIPMKTDNVGPVITIVKGAGNSYLINQSQQIGFQVVDAESGIKSGSVICKVAGVAVACAIDSKGIGSFSFTRTVPGPVVVSVEATDNRNNSSSKSLTIDIIKDTNAPVITITESSSNPSVPLTGNPLTFEFTIVKVGNITPITSVVCKDSTGKVITCNLGPDNKTGSFTTSFPTAGSQSVTVTATDGAGNTTIKTYPIVIKTKGAETTPIMVSDQKALDVLIVIDNSGSMSQEQKNMAQRINSLVSKLAGTDWRVGVITTDVSSTSTQGRLRQMTPAVLTIPTSPAKYFMTNGDANAQSIIGNTVQGAGISGSASEQGIAATYYSIINKDIAPNSGFFRANAGLSVILISDENESASQTANSGDNLISTIQSTWPNKAFKFHSIVETGTGCGSTFGTKYMDLSRKTGGEIACITQTDYSATLEKIGVSTSTLVNSATLKCAPLNGTVSVKKDGANYNGTFKLVGAQITFDVNLPTGNYSLNYDCIK